MSKLISMKFTIEFNKCSLDPKTDSILVELGGFELQCGDESYGFDFYNQKGYIDKSNRNITTFELTELDTDSFESSELITPDIFASTGGTMHFHLDYSDDDIQAITVSELEFTFDTGEIIVAGEKMLEQITELIIDDPISMPCDD
ncbi:MAG: hypothetical protein WCR33_06215 [Bacilli bacterium]